jgi:hypothetical protein
MLRERSLSGWIFFIGFFVFLVMPCSPAVAQQNDRADRHEAIAVDGVEGVLKALETHQLVGVSEHHRNKQVHDFLQSLITAPGFAERVDDIIVECGNALYQDVMDRYMSGEEVPREEFQKVWRNTTQLLVWDSPLYEALFETIREVNQKLPVEEQVRVVLADPPIDWSKVKNKDDYDPFASRDPDWVRVIENDVLKKGRTGFLIAGGVHYWARSARNDFKPVPIEEASLGEALDQRYPDNNFFYIALVPSTGSFSKQFSTWQVPSMIVLKDTTLGAKSFGHLRATPVIVRRLVDGKKTWVELQADNWPPMEEMVDGLLYLGKQMTYVPALPDTYQDKAYVEELKRRAAILDAFYSFEPGDGYADDLKELIKQ